MNAQQSWSSAPFVVGVDGSPGSAAALRWAVAEAGGRGVRAVAAWTGIVATGPDGAVLSIEEVQRGRQRAVERFVRETVGEHPGTTVRAEAVRGEPADVLAAAGAEGALLVLGSHGRGRLLGVLLGSVTTACLRRAHCPVVVMPASLSGGHRQGWHELANTDYDQGPLL